MFKVDSEGPFFYLATSCPPLASSIKESSQPPGSPPGLHICRGRGSSGLTPEARVFYRHGPHINAFCLLVPRCVLPPGWDLKAGQVLEVIFICVAQHRVLGLERGPVHSKGSVNVGYAGYTGRWIQVLFTPS